MALLPCSLARPVSRILPSMAAGTCTPSWLHPESRSVNTVRGPWGRRQREREGERERERERERGRGKERFYIHIYATYTYVHTHSLVPRLSTLSALLTFELCEFKGHLLIEKIVACIHVYTCAPETPLNCRGRPRGRLRRKRMRRLER